jgi:hypothetical protein
MNPNNYYKVSVRTTLAIGGGPGFVQTTPLKPNPITDGHCERARILTWVFPFHDLLGSSRHAAKEAAFDLQARLETILAEHDPSASPSFSLFNPHNPAGFSSDVPGIGVFPEPTADTTDPEFLH